MNRKPSKATCLAALVPWLVPFPATFLGVLFAAQVYSCNERANTKANLLQVHRVARTEAAESLEILKELAVEQPASTLLDDRRLTLERPATGLATLVGMPAFLEYGNERIVPELLSLSRRLTWSVDFKLGGGQTVWGESFSPPIPDVIEKLRKAITLLDQQIEELESQ